MRDDLSHLGRLHSDYCGFTEIIQDYYKAVFLPAASRRIQSIWFKICQFNQEQENLGIFGKPKVKPNKVFVWIFLFLNLEGNHHSAFTYLPPQTSSS